MATPSRTIVAGTEAAATRPVSRVGDWDIVFAARGTRQRGRSEATQRYVVHHQGGEPRPVPLGRRRDVRHEVLQPVGEPHPQHRALVAQ